MKSKKNKDNNINKNKMNKKNKNNNINKNNMASKKNNNNNVNKKTIRRARRTITTTPTRTT